MLERDNAKQSYEPPLLIVEGDVTDLTAGGVGNAVDNLSVGSL